MKYQGVREWPIAEPKGVALWLLERTYHITSEEADEYYKDLYEQAHQPKKRNPIC